MENKFNIAEEIAWLNNFSGYSGLWNNGTNDGNIYVPISGGAGAAGGGFFTAWYWMQTQWFNRWQRYMGRWGYMSNAYCATAVNNLTILALGNGFQFQTPNKSKQKKLNKWVKDTDFRCRDIEAFKRYLIDGETFIRRFDNDKLRFIDPDYIYNSTTDQNRLLGIVTEPTDYEDIKGYIVHNKPNDSYEGEFVSADEIQHRSNAHFGMRRGQSWLLPIMTDAIGADRLTNNLIKTSDVLANFAFFRKHVSPQASVQAFRDGIANQPINQYPIGQNGTPPVRLPSDNIENYSSGSIIDLPQNIEIEQLTGLPAESYINVLNASLRKIASHFHLPITVFSDHGERGAYAAELVSDSYLVRAISALQEDWINYDLELLEMCGFDTEDITIEAPQISTVDSDKLVKEMNFLLSQQIISKKTVAKAFEQDYAEELKLIKSEGSVVNINDGTNRTDLSGSSNGNGENDSTVSQNMRTEV